MKCFVCSKGMNEGVSLFRQNPKGEIGIWACILHAKEEIDPVVLSIVKVIENDSNNSGSSSN